MNKKHKDIIDNMTQFEMCRMWRFSEPGNPLFQGDTGDYFSKVLNEKGGFTPAISKALGWN